MNDKAIETLWVRSGAATVSPQEIRFVPLWSRLHDDPRFNQILQGAKPL